MADHLTSAIVAPTPEQRRVAAGQYARANQVIATGNHDYGMQLLLSCCKLEPTNLTYRRALRQTEKTKYKNNLRGSTFALVTTSKARAQMKVAMRSQDYLRVLELGEEILTRNPWDTGVQISMGAAAEHLGQIDLAIWILDQARQKEPNNAAVNRPMARLLEQRGYFAHAVALWALVRQAVPDDVEAKTKVNDLAAAATIARAQYATVTDQPPPESVNTAGPLPTQTASNELSRLHEQIEKDPTNPKHYLNLASCMRRAGKLREAAAVLKRGLAPTGQHFDLAIEIAELSIEPFRKDLAIAESKLRDEPDDPDLLSIRARLAKEVNSRELELHRQKADHYPTDKSHRFEFGVRLFHAGQIDEAIREFQAARSDPRMQWRALLQLGYCFNARNNWRLAERNFEDALKQLPPNDESTRKELLYTLASGSAKAGNLAKAVEYGYELANLDFGHRDIGKLLDEWQQAVT